MKEERRDHKYTLLKMLIFLAIPTVIEEVLSTLLQYVDTAMVGHLGEEATAAVNVTTTVTWLIGCTYSAVGIGVLSLIARAEGEGDREQVKTITWHCSWRSCCFGSLLYCIWAFDVCCI